MTLEPDDPRRPPRRPGCATSPTTMPGVRRRRGGARVHATSAPTAGASPIQIGSRGSSGLAIPPAWTDVWICADQARPHPGHRPRRARPQAVPLPPALARGARRGEVRAPDRVRPGAAADPPPDRSRPAPARAAAREGAGARRAPARGDAHPRRQRGVRARERQLRPARRCATATSRATAPRSASASAARAGKEHEIADRDRRLARLVKQCQELPGQELFQYVDDDGDAAVDRLRRRERVPARDHRRGVHRQGLPHLGRARSRPSMALAGFLEVDDDAGRKKAIVRRHRVGRRASSATRRRSAAPATSTPTSSTRTSTAPWWTPSPSALEGRDAARTRCARRRRPCSGCSSRGWRASSAAAAPRRLSTTLGGVSEPAQGSLVGLVLGLEADGHAQVAPRRRASRPAAPSTGQGRSARSGPPGRRRRWPRSDRRRAAWSPWLK